MIRLRLWFIILLTFLSYYASGQGGKILINKIEVIGNLRTKSATIMREINFQPGDSLPAAQVQGIAEQTERNLKATRLFNEVQVNVVPVTPSIVEVFIFLKERWYWYPGIILKHGDTNFNTWWLTKDLSRANFGLNLWKQNFRGYNEDIQALVQFGYSNQFGVSYYKPWFKRMPKLGLGFSTGFYQRDEIVIGTDDNKRIFYSTGTGQTRQEILGVITGTYRKGIRDLFTVDLIVRHLELIDTSGQMLSDYLPMGSTSFTYAGINAGFRLDLRDNPGYPEKGSFIDFHISWRGMNILPTGLQTAWCEGDLRKYFDLGKRFFAGTGVRFKLNMGERIPYYFQEGLGYEEYVRGYEYYVMDGQHYALVKSNIKFKALDFTLSRIGMFSDTRFTAPWFKLYLTAYADGGYVWDQYYATQNPLSNRALLGWGVGVDITSWYDWVMRVEYSWNHQMESGIFLHFTQPI